MIAGILWGSAGVFVRILNEFGMDRYTVLSTRMLVVTIILLAVLLIFDREKLKIRLKDIWLFLGSGILIGILSAFFCALYGIFSKLAANKGYSTYTIIFYSLLIITIVLFPFTDWGIFAAFLQEAPVPNTFFAVAHSACTSILPYALYSIALLHMENGKVSILAGGGEPMAAVVMGALFFSEIPTVLNIVGLAVTITALSLLCMSPKSTGAA